MKTKRFTKNEYYTIPFTRAEWKEYSDEDLKGFYHRTELNLRGCFTSLGIETLTTLMQRVKMELTIRGKM